MVERAAYLLRGIVQDHPFADGNKRTAYEIALTFMDANGWSLHTDADDVVDFMLACATGRHDVQSMESWIRHRAQPLTGGSDQ